MRLKSPYTPKSAPAFPKRKDGGVRLSKKSCPADMCGWTGHIQDSEAELLPAAETSEAELGPPSKFTSALRRAMEIWATATISAESVRGRKAECAVQR